MGRFWRLALISGLYGAVFSGLTLVLLSYINGGAGIAPINASSHWLLGPERATSVDVTLMVTGIGLLTHVASCLFWGVVFAGMVFASRAMGIADMLGLPAMVIFAAILTGLVAWGLDYGLLPEQLTPGWHLVLPASNLPLAFVMMALGLVSGGLAVIYGYRRRRGLH